MISVSVHLDYNQSINSPEAVQMRLLKYLVPVVISSVAFNVPKFMEAEIEYEGTINGTEFNSTIHDAEDESIDWEPRVSLRSTD